MRIWICILLVALVLVAGRPVHAALPQGVSEPASPAPATTDRVVLAELFVADWCTHCPAALQALEQLAGEHGPQQLLVLEYHQMDDYATTETEARAAEYEVEFMPTAAFDGPQNPIVGGSYAEFQERIDEELAQGSSLDLAAVRWAVGNTLHFSATLTNQGPGILNDVALRFVVYEDVGDLHRYVVRDMLPPLDVPPLDPGQSATLAADSDALEGVDLAQAGGVAFVQESASPGKAILQAAAATAPPVLRLSLSNMTFLIEPGGAAESASLRIDDATGTGFTWTLAEDIPWLAAAPLSGSTPATVTVTADTAGLTSGQWYDGQMILTAGPGVIGSPCTIEIRLYYGPLQHSYLPLVQKRH